MKANLKLLLAAILPLLLGVGPCAVLPGGVLSGPVHSGPVDDWSFTNDVDYCQVETRPYYPHSVTVNCWALDDSVYLSCSQCEGKTWSGYALENPFVRIKIGQRVYPGVLTRIDDSAGRERSWNGRWQKVGDGSAAPPVPDHWWTFRLSQR